MIELSDTARRKWLAAGAVLLVLAIPTTWAISKMRPRAPDDAELLLQNATKERQGEKPVSIGKVTRVEASSSTGQPVHASLTEVREASGRVGFAVRQQEELKPGETTTIKMPGGGTIEMTPAIEGEVPKRPQAKSGSPR
jgi:hypothetical protein